MIETLQIHSATRFAASWSWSLKLVTFSISAILLAVAFHILRFTENGIPIALVLAGVAPLVLLVVAMLFIIKGYVINDQQLLVERPGWDYVIELGELQQVYVDPNAMARSLRLFGNGGLFCFAGLFQNKTLGRYRVFATNPRNAVVLKFPARTIVVSPDNPEKFVSTTQQFVQDLNE